MTRSPLTKPFLIAILLIGSLTVLPNTAFCWIIFTLNPQYIPADGHTSCDVPARIIEFGGNRVGCPVHFSIKSGTGSVYPIDTETGTDGIAHTTYTPSDATPQIVEILATSVVQVPMEGGGTTPVPVGGTGLIILVKVEVTNPAEGGKVAITDDSKIVATAQLLPTELKKKLHWETTIGGTKFEADSFGTTSPQLVNITMTFPEENDSWGSNILKAVLPDNVLCFDAQSVKYFFPKDGTQKDPINWYYYWKQTGASSGTHQYNENPPEDLGDANGYYNDGENHFYICPSAGGLDGGLVAKGYGIDNFGSTCLHEKGHMDYWLDTWGSVSSSPVEQDHDRDGLKDADEPSTIGLNGQPYDPTKKDTNGDGYDDFEDLACKAENAWVEDSYNTVDWAYPGHQYP